MKSMYKRASTSCASAGLYPIETPSECRAAGIELDIFSGSMTNSEDANFNGCAVSSGRVHYLFKVEF